MNSKVTGKKTTVLGYFGALLAMLSLIAVIVFIAQLRTSMDNIGGGLFAKEMLYLQLSIAGILAPSLAFCSYLSLGLKLTSRLFKRALTAAGLVMLAIFPIVSLVGIYTLWLSRETPEVSSAS